MFRYSGVQAAGNTGVGRWALGLGVLVACAVPVQAGQGGKGLFPIGKGSTWSYKGQAAGQVLNLNAIVTSSKTAGGTSTVVFRWTMNGNPVQDEAYVVTRQSVSRVKSGVGGSNIISPPLPVILNPMTVGKSWNWKGSIAVGGGQPIPAEATLKVASRETVKSAAGSFSAFRVNMDLRVTAQGQTARIPNSYWFAPGAGLVRQQVTLGATVIDATVTNLTVK